MGTRTQSYGHFCLLAKTLEQVGDRWALLVVRDLELGPRRFTDLMQLLGGITPKTLTQRLHDLEDDGIVVADRVAGRREVWYGLTPTGEELVPILNQLLRWGLHHSLRRPEPGEEAHPEHLLRALRETLEESGPPPVRRARWLVRVPGYGAYAVTFDGQHWSLSLGEVEDGDVTITASREALSRFLSGPPSARKDGQPDVAIAGSAQAIRAMLAAISVFPPGLDGAGSDA
jgi:DNA-binding HxlR family transcriptional regulator